MESTNDFTYLVLSGTYLAMAVFCLVRLKQIRWPILITGMVMSAGGPLSEFFYIPEYWNKDFINLKFAYSVF
ncbi:MAG: hypothetical protein NTW49_14740 [Bacteroidia bacterium]|nr:hypothetical protein [Bacteroidia bacterium]